MSKTLDLSAGGSDLTQPTGTVGLLCEFASDSRSVQATGHGHGPRELLGSPDAALAVAYPLVAKLLQAAPVFDGFSPLGVFEETLLEQCSSIVQAFNLDRWISAGGFSRCRFASHTPWLDRLRGVQGVTGSTYEIDAHVPVLETGIKRRALQRLWKSRPTLSEFSRRITPLWSRSLTALSERARARSAPRGGIWFYSTAYNYTKIGLEYERYLPLPMHYVVEDAATGGKRLRELGRDLHLLYAWSRKSDIPSRREVQAIGERITAAVSAVTLSEEESALRAVLLKSEWWQLFLTRRLAFVLFNSRALQRWFRDVEPEMILVGNAGYERALLLHENVRRVPVVMLQHGIMHWVYGVADQPVDIFVLRGEFFQRVLNAPLRRKTVIHNFPEPVQTTAPQDKGIVRESILFITTPYDVPALYHPADRRDILCSLLRAAHGTERPLIIRAHPLDKVVVYQEIIAELKAELGVQVEVSYSQGSGVEEVLARSCVAVLHFSTMFLDCLRHGIPIVTLGWHWFPNQRQFEEEGIFNFARDLADLEQLIANGVEGRLPDRHLGLQQFLAPAEPDEISMFFRETWNARRSNNQRAHGD